MAKKNSKSKPQESSVFELKKMLLRGRFKNSLGEQVATQEKSNVRKIIARTYTVQK